MPQTAVLDEKEVTLFFSHILLENLAIYAWFEEGVFFLHNG